MALPSLVDTKYQPREYHRTKPRWYHSHIIDWMMANPNGKLEDCAKFVGKRQATLSAIIRSDMFQAALAERKRQYANLQDARISQKLTEVAISSMDTILAVIDKKKDSIPLETLNAVATGALAKLGYGTTPQAGPSVQVNVQQNAAPIHTPVSNAELEAARSALRQHQRTIADSPSSPLPVGDSSDAAGPLLEATAIEEPQK